LRGLNVAVGVITRWYFPAGHPHSIQVLDPDGCEFLLVFDQGDFSDYNTLPLSQWLTHTPLSVLSKNFELPESALSALTKLPSNGLYIFPAALPRSLAQDKQSVGGPQAETHQQYTFKMGAKKGEVLARLIGRPRPMASRVESS
jgi:oxalate decarboxylase